MTLPFANSSPKRRKPSWVPRIGNLGKRSSGTVISFCVHRRNEAVELAQQGHHLGISRWAGHLPVEALRAGRARRPARRVARDELAFERQLRILAKRVVELEGYLVAVRPLPLRGRHGGL